MKKIYALKQSFVLSTALLFFTHYIQAQNIFPATGRAGIFTTAPAASLQVRGGARIGTLANYINIDSATGNLSLVGTANYKVGGNKYAFQYSGNANYGLFFNSTNVRYEFRNSAAAATFFVGADNGNGYFLGNLGLGTTTAAAKLDVIGKIKMTDGTQGVGKILTSDANGLARWATPAVLPWTTNGNDIFNSNTGNIGIGTNTPIQKLDIRGSGIDDGAVINLGNSDNSHQMTLFGGRANDPNPYIGWAVGDPLVFASYPNGFTEWMRIAANGNVGIGNASPGDRLSVEGTFITNSTDGFFRVHPYYGISNNTTVLATLHGTTAPPQMRFEGYGFIDIGQDGSGNFTVETNDVPGLTLTYGNNNVGIGMNTPNNRLVVSDNTNQNPTAIIQNLRQPGTTSDVADGLSVQAGRNDGLGTSYYTTFVRPDGLFIGTISQNSANSVGYNTTSDKRLKTNIHETKYGLADVRKIQVRDYKFINGKAEQTGFIAQQLYEVFPEAVSVGGEDVKKRPWMVDYGRVTPLLVKAIQDLDAVNAEKQAEVNTLKTTVAAQQKQIDKLQSQMETLIGKLSASQSEQPVISRQSITFNDAAGLEQNTPNPFSASTIIRYTLPQKFSNAQIIITDKAGKVLKQVNVSGSGKGFLQLNASAFSSSSYQYSLLVDGKLIDTKQMILAK